MRFTAPLRPLPTDVKDVSLLGRQQFIECNLGSQKEVTGRFARSPLNHKPETSICNDVLLEEIVNGNHVPKTSTACLSAPVAFQ